MLRRHRVSRLEPNLVLVILVIIALCVAGGASKAEAPGQLVVRGACFLALILAALLGPVPVIRDRRPVFAIAFAMLALVLLHLVPLPPALWQMLPGRAPFEAAATISGHAQPWRPLALVPSSAANAAMSLVVPLTMLVLVSGLEDRRRGTLLVLTLCVVLVASCVGIFQFAGVDVIQRMVDNDPGEVTGIFANRNHFALLLAMGCVIAPVWALRGDRRPGWRGPAAIALVLLFALLILATGSRAGIVVGVVAIGFAVIIGRGSFNRELQRLARWARRLAVATPILAVVGVIGLSIFANRAESVSRVLTLDPSQDMRARALPTVRVVIETYFPVGGGIGSFERLFMVHEPFDFLGLTYLNHAHNEYLEIASDGGLPAILLLIAAILWWAVASYRVWRHGSGATLARLGSVMIFLVMIASLFDYPARTPIIMALIAIAALWLSDGRIGKGAAALPRTSPHL